MIEFAILAPVFILLLMGIIEVGRYAYLGILAANAARAGVQYGAQNTMTAAQTNAIKAAALQDGQNLSTWAITPTTLCSVNGATPTAAACSGVGVPVNTIYYVQVQVAGTFTSLFNYPGIPHSAPIGATAIMRVASQ